MWVTDTARIWRCCGCGVGRQLQMPLWALGMYGSPFLGQLPWERGAFSVPHKSPSPEWERRVSSYELSQRKAKERRNWVRDSKTQIPAPAPPQSLWDLESVGFPEPLFCTFLNIACCNLFVGLQESKVHSNVQSFYFSFAASSRYN